MVGALGMVFARNAVHSALWLALTMLCLGVLLHRRRTPTSSASVQIIVYTGAIMMLFLFVLMLVGVDPADSLVETLRGQRLGGRRSASASPAARSRRSARGPRHARRAWPTRSTRGRQRPASLASCSSPLRLGLRGHPALLITAALGAMVLAHRERLRRKADPARAGCSERDPSAGTSPLPGPGVYARHNAVDTPALLPDGTIVASSGRSAECCRGARRKTAVRRSADRIEGRARRRSSSSEHRDGSA